MSRMKILCRGEDTPHCLESCSKDLSRISQFSLRSGKRLHWSSVQLVFFHSLPPQEPQTIARRRLFFLEVDSLLDLDFLSRIVPLSGPHTTHPLLISTRGTCANWYACRHACERGDLAMFLFFPLCFFGRWLMDERLAMSALEPPDSEESDPN